MRILFINEATSRFRIERIQPLPTNSRALPTAVVDLSLNPRSVCELPKLCHQRHMGFRARLKSVLSFSDLITFNLGVKVLADNWSQPDS